MKCWLEPHLISRSRDRFLISRSIEKLCYSDRNFNFVSCWVQSPKTNSLTPLAARSGEHVSFCMLNSTFSLILVFLMSLPILINIQGGTEMCCRYSRANEIKTSQSRFYYCDFLRVQQKKKTKISESTKIFQNSKNWCVKNSVVDLYCLR